MSVAHRGLLRAVGRFCVPLEVTRSRLLFASECAVGLSVADGGVLFAAGSVISDEDGRRVVGAAGPLTSDC